MMKTSWGIPICLGMIILLLGFFARAEIQSQFSVPDAADISEQLCSSNRAQLIFQDEIAIQDLNMPGYARNAIAPSDEAWQLKTIQPISQYLKKYNARALRITGLHLQNESEIAIGGYENIGAARAGFLANQLIEHGIAAPRILISDRLIEQADLTVPFEFELLNDSELIP